MVNYLGNKACASGWMPQEALDTPREGLGVLLRQSRGQYMCRPVNIEPSLLLAVQRLNVAVAMTIRPDMLESIFNTLEPFQTELRLKDGSQLQIIQSLTSITASTVKKFQYACLLRQERTVLVWHDDVNQILIHAGRVEERLLSFVRSSSTFPQVNMLILWFRPDLGRLRGSYPPLCSRHTLTVLISFSHDLATYHQRRRKVPWIRL